jgi:uncharacterized membrane-anchored protein YhcB (DUF1043 family)
MFSFITGKIKTAIIVILSVGLPILYVLGRLTGGSKIKQAVLKEEAEKAERRADFYKAIAEDEREIEANKPDNRDELVSKLRSDGL